MHSLMMLAMKVDIKLTTAFSAISIRLSDWWECFSMKSKKSYRKPAILMSSNKNSILNSSSVIILYQSLSITCQCNLHLNWKLENNLFSMKIKVLCFYLWQTLKRCDSSYLLVSTPFYCFMVFKCFNSAYNLRVKQMDPITSDDFDFFVFFTHLVTLFVSTEASFVSL